MMLFHAYEIQNRAVWNAMQLHAHLLTKAGEDIIFIVHSDNKYLVSQQFPAHPILIYNNYLNFLKIILKNPNHKIFSSTYKDVLMVSPLKFFKPLKIYYWIQGIIPEESYIKHKSFVRKSILSFFEKTALRLSSYHIVVSTYMQKFLKDKYRVKLNTIIIPCTSDLNYRTSTKTPNSFVYVGGMSAWQRFDIMLEMFNHITEFIPEAHFYVATEEIKKAKELIRLHLKPSLTNHISIQPINNRHTMEEFLNAMEYGFLIRDNDPVNNVSSPIKLAEYLSCGVNVIISRAVSSYAPLVEKYGAGICIENLEDIDKIKALTPSVVSSLQLYKDYFLESSLADKYKVIL